MSVSMPDALWPIALSAVIAIGLLRWKCIEVAEGYAKFVFSVVSLGLPQEAKRAWRNEALWHIIEAVSLDRARGLSREAAALGAGFNATTLLTFGWQDRSYYRAGFADRQKSRASWLLDSATQEFPFIFASLVSGHLLIYRFPAWAPAVDLVLATAHFIVVYFIVLFRPWFVANLCRWLETAPAVPLPGAWLVVLAPFALTAVLQILGLAGLDGALAARILIPISLMLLLPTWARTPVMRPRLRRRPDG